MTRYLLCDYCGETIEENDYYVAISATSSREGTRGGSGCAAGNELLGHFHATGERCCYDELVDQMLLVMETHSDLERLDGVGSADRAAESEAPQAYGRGRPDPRT